MVTEIELLTSLLEAEHAALYGYGVLGARLAVQQRAFALQVSDAHRARRDGVGARLRERGAAVPVAQPSYAVSVHSPEQGVALAVRLEEGLGLRWRALAGGTDDQALRRLGVSGLQETAVRAAQWRRLAGRRPITVALPGAPA